MAVGCLGAIAASRPAGRRPAHRPRRRAGRRDPARGRARRPTARRRRAGPGSPARRARPSTAAVGPPARRRHPVPPARGPRRRAGDAPRAVPRRRASSSRGCAGPGPGYAAWAAALAGVDAPEHGTIAAGDHLAVDDVALEVRWPIRGTVPLQPADGGTAINNVSVVLLGTVGDRRFLLTGDVEEDVDPSLLAAGLPRVDVLKVAHHGSRTATTDAFLAAVRPRVAIASAGTGQPLRPSRPGDARAPRGDRRSGLPDGRRRLRVGHLRARRSGRPARSAALGRSPTGRPGRRRPGGAADVPVRDPGLRGGPGRRARPIAPIAEAALAAAAPTPDTTRATAERRRPSGTIGPMPSPSVPGSNDSPARPRRTRSVPASSA